MRIVVFASGSSGNCTFVELGNHRLLIDVGVSCRCIMKNLQKYGVEVSSLEAILITHTHGDHIQGLKTFVKTYDRFTSQRLPLLLSESTWRYAQQECDISGKVQEYIFAKWDVPMRTPWSDNLTVTPLLCHHDVPCNGFLLQSSEASLVYMTDTGMVDKRYLWSLNNKEFYIFESNYDEDMLDYCNYADVIKQRIDSSMGHLANSKSARYLAKLVGPKTRKVVLAHLSANSNHPDVALRMHRKILQNSPLDVNNIVCALRKEDVVVV